MVEGAECPSTAESFPFFRPQPVLTKMRLHLFEVIGSPGGSGGHGSPKDVEATEWSLDCTSLPPSLRLGEWKGHLYFCFYGYWGRGSLISDVFKL